MASILLEEEEPKREITLGLQTASFLTHALLALISWAALMAVGYLVNPEYVPQWAILAASILFPLIVGSLVNRARQSEMASAVWMLGIIWFMIIALWIVDMPTGSNQCFQCTLSEKLSRSFLSWPMPSGLVDDDGPFLGTWPATALVGYSIGARLGLRKAEERG